jgi:hypothetical protein
VPTPTPQAFFVIPSPTPTVRSGVLILPPTPTATCRSSSAAGC